MPLLILFSLSEYPSSMSLHTTSYCSAVRKVDFGVRVCLVTQEIIRKCQLFLLIPILQTPVPSPWYSPLHGSHISPSQAVRVLSFLRKSILLCQCLLLAGTLVISIHSSPLLLDRELLEDRPNNALRSHPSLCLRGHLTVAVTVSIDGSWCHKEAPLSF